MERIQPLDPHMQLLKAQWSRIMNAARARGADTLDATTERMAEFGQALRRKYGEKCNEVAAFHVLAGSGMREKPKQNDFEGEDSIAAFLDRLEKEV